jgi:hypothetical protein
MVVVALRVTLFCSCIGLINNYFLAYPSGIKLFYGCFTLGCGNIPSLIAFSQ